MKHTDSLSKEHSVQENLRRFECYLWRLEELLSRDSLPTEFTYGWESKLNCAWLNLDPLNCKSSLREYRRHVKADFGRHMKGSPSELWLPPGVTPEEEKAEKGVLDLIQKNVYRKIDPSIEELGKREVGFLIRFGKALSKHIPEVSSFEQFEEKEYGEVSEKDYLDLELQWFVNIPELLSLRVRFATGSRNKQLQNTQYFCESVLAHNVLFNHQNTQILMRRSEAVRGALAEILGLRKKKTIQRLRDEVIVECHIQGMSQKEICRELDSHEDLMKDSRLEKWAEALMLDHRLTYSEAFVHPRLGGNLKKIISTAEDRIS